MHSQYEELYHRVERQHWWFVGRRDLIRRLLIELSPGPDCRILDVGCAGGSLIEELRSAGYQQVAGIDVSPAAIARCRAAGIGDVELMDAARPGFAPGSFDVIIASDVLEHLDDAPAALAAWRRMLRPGGIIIAMVPAFMFLWGPHDVVNAHRRRYRSTELRAALSAAGLSIERLGYWNFLLFGVAAVMRLGRRLLPATPAGQGDIRLPAAPLNRLLSGVLAAENRVISAGLDWPWGLSVLAVARRPAAGERPA
jgi:2-polyprenyl-3-methyl-5-hydroxy-6-metoxy-1,4-benzoquinol methylase